MKRYVCLLAVYVSSLASPSILMASSQSPIVPQSPDVAVPAACAASDPQPERQLTGTVTDAQGARIAGASVTVRCGAFERRTVSGADGRFAIRVPPAALSVIVEHAGFDAAVLRVDVGAEGDREIAVGLTVGQRAEAVEVRGAGEPSRRSTTATKMDVPLLETPQSVTVITAEQIRDQASPNLQEAVRYAPGVRHELYGIDNRGDWVSLRGSDESTTLLDGMRLPLTGWWGTMRTEPYAYERIDVLRGPSSIIAGQNDPGGVLNLVSKRPQAEAAREIGVRTGSYAHREMYLDVTGPIDAERRWLYRLVTLGKDTGTQVVHADEQRVLVAPSLTWRPAPVHAVTFYGDYQYDRSKNTNAFLGLEGTLLPAPNGPIPTDVFIGEPAWDRYGGRRVRLGYEANLSIGRGWRLRQNLRHDRVDGLMKSMYAAWWSGFLDGNGDADREGRYLGREWYLYDDQSQVTATEALVEGHQRTGRVTHALLAGIDGMWHDERQISAAGSATPLDVYTPTYGTYAEPSFGDDAPTETRIRRLGFLVQDQMKFAERISVRLGVRRDRISNGIVGSDPAIDRATSVNVGAVYEVIAGLASYVSYSESFNPVAGTDAQGDVFKPKRGEQIEAGLKWEMPSRPVQATFAWYGITERNRLASDPDNVNYSIQIGEAKIRGVEFDVKGEVASWDLLSSFTRTRARASAGSWGGDLDPNQQIEGIPEHQASVWAVHDFSNAGLAGVRFGGGLRYVGRVGDGTGQVFVPSVTLLDLMASYERPRWRFSLNVNNLTDKPYIATCLARGDCWFGARRSVSLTAAFRY